MTRLLKKRPKLPSPAKPFLAPKVSLRIACVGDSLSTGFRVGSVLSSIWSAHLGIDQGWFNSRSPAINSLTRRLADRFHVRAKNLARVSAHAIPPEKRAISYDVLSTLHLAEQVNVILTAPTLPDIVLIWIGHNDLDLAADRPWAIDRFANEIAGAIVHDVKRLATNERFSSARRTIIVFGLVDFASFFRGRDAAMAERVKNKLAFPYLERCHDIFPSMRPENREVMVRTACAVNEMLKETLLVEPEGVHVRILYSDALSRVDISTAASLSPSDAWHPSEKSHQGFAAAAESVVVPEAASVLQARKADRVRHLMFASKSLSSSLRLAWPLLFVASTWVAMAAIVHWKYGAVDRPKIEAMEVATESFFSSKELFTAKLATYRALDSSLHNNMVIQSVFVVLGFFSLLGRSKDIELPVLKVRLPLSWIYYVVPVSLLFTWLHFGFHLDDVINTRAEAHQLLLSTEKAESWRKVVGTQLNDSGFADAWFFLYRPGEYYIDNRNRLTVMIFFPLVFGSLLGLTHAMIAGMLVYANARYASEIADTHFLSRVMIRLMPFLFLVILIASHRQFYVGGDNPNWFQAWIAAFACMVTLIMLKIPLRKSVDDHAETT